MKDPLERKHGFYHEVFDWRNDWRWPQNGADSRALKRKLAGLTFARIAGKNQRVCVFAADGWSKWECVFFPNKTFTTPVCIVRVNLMRKQSQYLGWVSSSEFNELEVVDWGYTTKYRRRVVRDWMLQRGLPDCVTGGTAHVTEDLHTGTNGRE